MKDASMNSSNYPLTLLYDGACPICALEMDNLKARNSAGLLAFADITAPGFDIAPYTRVRAATREQMLALIHAMRPDGSLVVGVEVFRLAYGAVGLGKLTAPTAWPIVKPMFDAAYAVFARHRYGLSKLAMPLIESIAARRAARRAQACNAQECSVNPLDRSAS
jgi:predicted DCC family thiol-disulfide oxidoreductase YuxK